jgi:threonine-phosphate decarboxylase
MTVHGGDVWRVAQDLGIRVDELLDFSANVNPRGLPPRALERLARDAANLQFLGLYPDPSARALRTVLSRRLDVPEEAIVIGPGAEALLNPALRCLNVDRALVPIPAFSEYRRVCAQQRVEFVPFPLDRSDYFRVPVNRLCASIESQLRGVVFLNNPHNPSGALLEAAEARRILDTAASTGTAVLLDEAFIDYAPRASMVQEATERTGLIVLRSLTKFYGCPALRAGYAVAHPDTIRQIASLLPTWPITQLAIDALSLALEDREYAELSLRENATERAGLSQSLQALGLTVFPSAANYLLCELQPHQPRASELRLRMIDRHRILIRNCDSYEGLAPGSYVRVAVRSGSENARLTEALAEELRQS